MSTCRRLALATVLACTAACGGGSASVQPVSVSLSAPPSLRMARVDEIAMMPLMDARPASLRQSHGPHQQQRFSLLMIGPGGGAYMNGVRTEGQTLVAGDHIRLNGGQATKALQSYVEKLLQTASSGGDVRTLKAMGNLQSIGKLEDMQGVTDGLVIVPILDQLDVSSLSSKNTMSGASSHEVSRTTTTVTRQSTTGAASLSSGTPDFANVRLRYLILRVAGGKVAGRHVIYARGYGPKLDVAIDQMGRELARGLETLFAETPISPALDSVEPPTESADTGAVEPIVETESSSADAATSKGIKEASSGDAELEREQEDAQAERHSSEPEFDGERGSAGNEEEAAGPDFEGSEPPDAEPRGEGTVKEKL